MDKEVKFERGQVWYVRYDDSIGDEMAIGRPVLILSNQDDIDEMGTVVVAYMTTGLRKSRNVVKAKFRGKDQFVHCSQLATMSKDRLSEYLGKLNDSCMTYVSKVLMTAIGCDVTTESEDIESETPMEEEKTVVMDKSELEMELAVYKRLYEKAVSEVVELRFEKDTRSEKVVEKIVEVEVEKIVEVEVEKIVEVEKVVEVEKIVEVPRELTEEEVLEWIDKLESKNETIEPEVTEEVVVEPEKVEVKKRGAKVTHGMGKNPTREQIDEFKKDGKANLNSDPWWVIAATTGMSANNARRIVAYRETRGNFRRVKDLIDVNFVKPAFIEKYGPMLEV